MPAIELQQLAKNYGDVRALDGVDLTVESGQIFGFLGPNGAGKTTTLRILLDLIRPTSGRALIHGFDAQREPIEARRRIGYVPDDPEMYETMTGLHYLELLASLRPDGVDIGYRDELIERLGLDPTRRIGTLSRGNRQKVGIVLALMAQPQLVVLDEPTTGLDPLAQEETHVLLREVAMDGRTVFFSSHLLAEVEQVCDRVAMLRDGRVLDVLEPAARQRLAPQRFIVTFDGPPALDGLDALDGVTVVSLDGPTLVMEVSGDTDAVVKRLAAHTVVRLETDELSLEELFRSYYEPAGEAEGVTSADPA
ncbi:MAG TPA: ABC transporter ATP-binding protein [Dehalococcoidia bacterium]|nr:ABC transporter ATP-binding protein [Dehalococcoidia bacterium]